MEDKGSKRKAREKEETGFYEAYAGFARSLRVWFVAYGVGGPVLFLTNSEAWEKIAASGEGKAVGYLFLSGVALQIFQALLYKSVMWYLYVGELGGSGQQSWLYKIADRVSECYVLEFLLDIGTLIVFAWATLKVFGIFTS